ncbi:MAG: hypothetical protein L0170_16690 [Acidobacteria bacterium]|nr:hypothetical protein [Acidobacteriota bacterium]
MDGILWSPAVFAVPGAIAAGVLVLVISAGAMILGYLADEARVGRPTTWPELPLPEVTTPKRAAEEVKLSRAA